MDCLIGYGAQEIITGGCCGALSNIEENVFRVPFKALRDEGTSYHYMKPSRFVEINKKAMKAIEKIVSKHGFEYYEVITWTTDGFYRETKEKVEYRKQEGCEVVKFPVFAALVNDEYVGYVVCRVDNEVVWVESIFVKEEYRRYGVATALHSKAEEIDTSYGDDTVYNYVHPNNHRMIEFLRKRGYTVLNLIEIHKPYIDEKLKQKISVGEHEFDY